MKTKKYKLFLFMIIFIPLLSSCNIFRNEEEVKINYDVEEVKDIDQMEDGSFYIKKSDGVFQKPYIGNVNFSRDSIYYMPDTNPKNIAWFGKDINKIPTMNRGDKILYKSSQPFREVFKIQRYYDLGYTYGISGFEKSSTNRYYFNINQEDGTNIDRNSSAKVLLETFGNTSVLLESIGDTPLRSGNISVAGTVKGLEKGKTYSNDIYLGTNLNRINIKADVKCFSASEENEITKFKFNKNKTVEFTFPNYYNSGYYLINGYGFVRYINSEKEFDENMNMNVPNVYPDKDEFGNDIVDDTTQYLKATDVNETALYIDHDQSAKITVTIDDSKEKEGKYTLKPTVKLIGSSSAFTLESRDGKVYEGSFEIKEGTYTIQITGLNGRTFKYRVDDLEKDTSINGKGVKNNNKENNKEEEKNDTQNEGENK